FNFLCTHFTAPHTCNTSSQKEAVYLDQDPADIYTRGEDAKIYCSHSIPSYNQILWYKQLETQLQFLGYMYLNNDNPETGVNVMMNGSSTCTLTIKGLIVNSSAVYFCAASHTVRCITAPQYINLPIISFHLFSEFTALCTCNISCHGAPVYHCNDL
uniref:Ig-like domain-containing protein n=1 Tax=Pundamilia nyererei TaxID=303518 RepID=A0A3B4FTX6_9CICH